MTELKSKLANTIASSKEEIKNRLLRIKELDAEKEKTYKEIDFINGQVSAMEAITSELIEEDIEEVSDMACKKGGAKKKAAPKKKTTAKKKGCKKC